MQRFRVAVNNTYYYDNRQNALNVTTLFATDIDSRTLDGNFIFVTSPI